jgi:hypothetical protein
MSATHPLQSAQLQTVLNGDLDIAIVGQEVIFLNTRMIGLYSAGRAKASLNEIGA